MADQVQASLDQMVPALRDLLDRGIFTQSEIKNIVARRRESEYLLRRLVPRKADYQRYIEAEKNLEKLRKLRKKMVLARQEAKERENQENNKGEGNEEDGDDNDKNDKKKSKSTMGDASIVQNLHLLFIRAKRKWQEDLTWHLQHAEFAKQSKSFQMLSRIYAEALQLHPRNESLWIEAASHEYFGFKTNDKDEQNDEGGGSVKSARVLLQRGIRINADSKNLWLQSFCLELHYIQKLKGRREILKLNTDVDKPNGDEEDKDTAAELDVSLKLPLIIYRNAIKAISTDVSFRMQFIEHCKLFPQTEAMVDYIMKSVETDFDNVADAWIARARFIADKDISETMNKTGFFVLDEPAASEVDDKVTKKRKRGELNDENDANDDKVLQILNQATDTMDTPKIFIESLIFLQWYITKVTTSLEEEEAEMDLAKGRMTKIIQFIVQLINKAESKVNISSELAIEMSSCLLEFGLAAQSLKLIKRLTNDNSECRKDAQCWLKIVDISEYINLTENGDKNLKSSCIILKKALKMIPLHDFGHTDILSRLFMNLLATSSGKSSDDELSSTYEKMLLLCHKNVEESQVSVPAVSLAYLRFASMKGDIQLARQVYKKFVYNSNYCKAPSKSDDDVETMKDFFDECILIENEEMKKNRLDRIKQKQQHRSLLNLCDMASKYFLHIDDRLANSYNRKRNEIS